MGDALYGRHVVSMALALRPAACQRLYVQTGLAEPMQDVVRAARAHAHIAVEHVDKMRLNVLCHNRPHQGVALVVSALPVIDLVGQQTMPVVAQPGKALLALAIDEVHDPGNLGGLLRAGFFFGACAVLLSAKNTCGVTAVAAKASAGASEALAAEKRLFQCRNLVVALDAHKRRGWRVLGTAAERGTLSDVPEAPLSILVLGNEGAGLRANVKALCDGLVHLPSSPSAAAMPDVSLNVTSAASAILARWQLLRAS